MIEKITNILDCNNHFRENINKIIDIFVDYYGEEEREHIEKRFDQTLLIAHRSPSSTISLVEQLKKEISNKLEKNILEQVDININESNLFDKEYFDNIENMPIIKFKKFYDSYKTPKEERLKAHIEEGINIIRKYIKDFETEDYLYVLENHKMNEKYDYLTEEQKKAIIELINSLKKKMDFEYENYYIINANSLLKSIIPEISSENFEEYIDSEEIKKLVQIAEMTIEKRKEYDEYIEPYSKYINEALVESKKKELFKTKYFYELIKENIDLIREDKKKNLEEYFQDTNNSYKLDKYVQFIFGINNISLYSPLESFSSQSEIILQEKETSFEAKKIKSERIQYFKLLGIDLGNDYEAYINNEEAKKLIPLKERVKEFLKVQEELQRKMQTDYYLSSSSYQQIREEIDSKGLENKDDYYSPTIYIKDTGTCVSPNIIKRNNEYQLYPVVFIDCSNVLNPIDHNIIHELNHLIEYEMLYTTEEEYEVISGWDSFTNEIRRENDIYEEDDEEEKREYELFNEIINELITQEICEKIRQNNTYIFETKETARFENQTSYEELSPLVKDFFEEFKDIIIKSRHNGNIELIWNELGKENIERLNSIIQIFQQNFYKKNSFKVLSDINNGIENEETILYKRLIFESQQLIEDMKNYKEQHKENTNFK